MNVFISVGALANGTGNITVGLPTSIEVGGLMLLVCESQAAQPVTAPAGWTECSFSPVIAAATRLTVFSKIATSSETSVTVVDAGNHTMGQIYAFQGVKQDLSAILQANAAIYPVGTSVVTLPVITPARKGNIVLHLMATNVNFTNFAVTRGDGILEESNLYGTANAYGSSGAGGTLSRAFGVVEKVKPTSTVFSMATTTRSHAAVTIELDQADGVMTIGKANLGFVVNLEPEFDGPTNAKRRQMWIN